MLPDGWCPLDEVRDAIRRHPANDQDVDLVVENSCHHDGTPRFQLWRSRTRTWIRATRRRTIRGAQPDSPSPDSLRQSLTDAEPPESDSSRNRSRSSTATKPTATNYWPEA